jgi:hypothetical protein
MTPPRGETASAQEYVPTLGGTPGTRVAHSAVRKAGDSEMRPFPAAQRVPARFR